MKKYFYFFFFLPFLLCYSVQKKIVVVSTTNESVFIQKNISDSDLLDVVQKQTFKYFWNFADPVSGMARERSNVVAYGHELAATGGTGFGMMSIIVAVSRSWITRDSAVDRLIKLAEFLSKADKYHGIFPHWMNGATGKTIALNPKDDGGDIVETSYLMEGLLCAREYFNMKNPKEKRLRQLITSMWNEVEYNWQTRGGRSILYWHWSPNNGWAMNAEIRGWNEGLITYVLAASSPKYSIEPEVYNKGWAINTYFYNGKKFYGYTLPLGFDYGGPLFFAHYSFLGLDPHGLKDQYADYWQQNQNHTLINYTYCIDNPKHYKGYGADCWGLTASDNYEGYGAQSPLDDIGVISPTAALSSFPYTPEYSMKALKHFYFDLGDKIWGEYGFTDAFSEAKNWYAKSYLAIDEGPIIVMIENYRTGLLWKLFMNTPEIQNGLKKLGFESPYFKK